MSTVPIQSSWGPKVPWATGQTATTGDVTPQPQDQPQFGNTGNPLYNGAYNPMYHQANNQKITMKDLASLYYKSQGQGVVGDNPHPFAAANEYANVGVGDGGGIGFNVAGSPVKNAKETRALLQAQIDLAGGNREAVFNQLTGKTNQALVKQQAEKAGVSTADAAELQGQAPNASSSGFENAGMQKWMQDYVSPYIQEEQAKLEFQANMFDQVASNIIPTMDPQKAEIMKAYMPLISQAYHQKAATFGTDFLTNSGPSSMIGQLLKQQKRNASAVNFLTKNNGGSGGIDSSFVQSLISGKG